MFLKKEFHLEISSRNQIYHMKKGMCGLLIPERVTRNHVVKFYKVMWSNQGSESDATWEREDYLKDVYPTFYSKWYAFQISGRDFYKG